MNERKLGGKANTYLLMTAKRVLPGREGKKQKTILFEKRFDVKHEILFVSRCNVFYYIVYNNEVVAFFLATGLFYKQEILSDESTFLMFFFEKSLGFVDTFPADVYSCHVGSFLCERE